jgi:plasmid stabilization system protein ParE
MDYVTLRKQAHVDFAEIIEYTENEWGFDQAAELVSIFEAAFQSLVDLPKLGRRIVRENSRALTLSKLPFVILYQTKGREIIVRQIIHMRKRR